MVEPVDVETGVHVLLVAGDVWVELQREPGRARPPARPQRTALDQVGLRVGHEVAVREKDSVASRETRVGGVAPAHLAGIHKGVTGTGLRIEVLAR